MKNKSTNLLSSEFEKLKKGDVLIGRINDTHNIEGKELPFITKDKEYQVVENSKGFITIVDDSGMEMVSPYRPLIIFFTIKK